MKSVLVIVRRDFGGFWRMHMRVLRSLLIMSVGRGLFVIVRVHMGMRVAVHGISVPMFVRMSVAVLVGVRTTVAHPVFSCLRDSPNIGSVRSVSTRRTAP